MRSSATWTMLGFALFVGSGCSPTSMATRAIKEMKGASSEIREIPGTVSGRFDRFKGASISPLRNELGGLVSEQFTSSLPAMLHKFLIEEKKAPFHGDSPKLTIEPQMQWFREASGRASSSAQIRTSSSCSSSALTAPKSGRWRSPLRRPPPWRAAEPWRNQWPRSWPIGS